MRCTSIVGYGKRGFILLLLLAFSPVPAVVAGAGEGEGHPQMTEGMPHGDAGDDGGDGMSGMHHGEITVPKEYEGIENPYWTDLEAIIEGHQIFRANCALCHGEKGAGDGILRSTLDPKPADFTKSEHMAKMNDDYLFWRVSEGGAFAPFDSAMPSFKAALTDDERWKVLAYEHAISHAILLDHEAGETVQPQPHTPVD